MIVIEAVAAINAAGTLSTQYVSTAQFTTAPSDTPANTFFNPCIMDAGSLGVHAFSDGRTGGASRLELGEVVLANADGALDSWLEYSFDGRPITIRSGEAGGAYPSSFSTIFVGTVDSVEADWEKLVIRLRDKQFIFDLPVLTTTYAGNNVLPAGLEGTADDLKGKVKPRVYGRVLNISPAFVNTSKLTYQVSDGAVTDITAVYDRGASLTKGANFATSTLLQAATPLAGTYITCFAEGYFRLGTSPSGTVTADVTQGANAAARTVAQIVKSLALSAGVTSGEISSSDVSALDTANSSVVGIYLSEAETFQGTIDLLLASVGGFSGFDSGGIFRMGRLLAPSGSPVTTLYDYDVFEDISRSPPKDNGIPVWKATVNHTKVYTTQTSDLAGTVTTANRAILAETYRSAVSTDASVKTQWLLSGELSVDTLLTTAADATTEADRLLAMYKVKRTIYEVGVDISVFYTNSLKIGDVVALNLGRFDLNGKLHRLIGYKIDLSSRKIYLDLWG